MSCPAITRILATLLAVGTLAACGYKGPLYLPDDDTQSARQPPPPAILPASTTTPSAPAAPVR